MKWGLGVLEWLTVALGASASWFDNWLDRQQNIDFFPPPPRKVTQRREGVLKFRRGLFREARKKLCLSVCLSVHVCACMHTAMLLPPFHQGGFLPLHLPLQVLIWRRVRSLSCTDPNSSIFCPLLARLPCVSGFTSPWLSFLSVK